MDLDWMLSSQGTPFIRSASNPSVISCSTSAADRPRASVWISTKGVEELWERIYGDVPKCQDSKKENRARDTQDQ